MKHFIFDMGGVLVKPIPHELVKDEISYVKCDTEEMKDFFWNTFFEYEKGNLNTKEYVHKLQPYFNKNNITPEEYEKTYYDIGKKYGGTFENAYSELRKLKDEGYKVYLLSNLHEVSFKDFSKIFDTSVFDKLFLSYEIGMIKPDNSIYQYVINKIHDDPKEMCFFDDKLENIESAKRNGMNAIQTTGDILDDNIEFAKKM
ncbi:MAG: HAD-IA family hydrolase [Clostridia bacterium]|nr:HAD-IA family hydrolase [Bacilli bacterium]MBR3324918.1 HAD-IA family hydrolase [Clostridia bacterium]